jgi:uncharacterized protein (DUF1501 family)
MSNLFQSRRRFLGGLLAAAGTTAIPFTANLAAMSAAAAADADDYKALVCVFLTGGNDHYNTVLSTDSSSWSEYQRLRAIGGSSAIAVSLTSSKSSLMSITPATVQAGRSFALNSNLGLIKDLFDDGSLAIVGNVGTLVQPTTKAQYLASSVPLPPKLFSHNDQQAVWQSNMPESSLSAGWGARLAEMMAAANSSSNFATVSTTGNALFLSGRTIQQFQISGSTLPGIKNLDGPLFGSTSAAGTLRSIITSDSTDLFAKEQARIVSRSIDAQRVLAGAVPPAGTGGVRDPSWYLDPVTGVNTVNPLAQQLQTVARMIAGRNGLGAKRQVFFVNLGGFDTHDAQNANHPSLLAQLAHGMAYFNNVMTNLQGADMRKQVTLFTASDFGRTLSSNGDGTDHGWGAHHFVMGGAVKGRDIYGQMPPIGLGHELDVGSGALLPTISVDQYGATLASWFGLSATQIADVFPNIGNFSNRNLGFMNGV